MQTVDIEDMLDLDQTCMRLLEDIEKFEFNIFEFMEACGHDELYIIPSFLMNKHNLFESCKIAPDKFFTFMRRVHNSYNNVTYHNKTHAADVCQNAYYFCMSCEFLEKSQMTDLEQTAMLVATSCHDLGHFGVNN